ncbi:GNAT family N-acetyltransferase [Bacillus suaedaesalsae]|uniref:GNAT family N-acetyltransferase n=1 Tax=Bacillus suaedaesalsae TaxID=2810349 RepID=A0ABS2DJF2_9BACI|nr:GNAT family N-acetyltransferase [Bacillus suaedaesalsae]MBM6618135.1 GNAT family N-acetyltransferase [Bacillus suaedaesalsae]
MHLVDESKYGLINEVFPIIREKVVIQGVLHGNNKGKVYVDNTARPQAALIWAINEMFYFVGTPTQIFVETVEDFIHHTIKPEALEIGEDCLNLEVYPFDKWEPYIDKIFMETEVQRGKRVPFTFHLHDFIKYKPEYNEKLKDYKFMSVNDEAIHLDQSSMLKTEVLKFWPSLEEFHKKGNGIAVFHEDELVGSCISVYVYDNHEEIGIHTYDEKHRGKGIASEMAHQFIKRCIEKEHIPHWTTEWFREDSIHIAQKLGFEKHDLYTVFFFPFIDE